MENAMDVRVRGGDIASVDADALITAINSAGMWFGGIDGVIQRAAGNMFHGQATGRDLVDGTAFAVTATGPHDGKFQNVVFVVDDLQQPLHDIVMAGLKAADEAGYKSVTLPTIRMGVMLGVVEKSVQEAFREMRMGVKTAQRELKNLETVTFVVYGDPGLEYLLRTEFASQQRKYQD
jgi:O-acetyl-ADP-ribose deacetylase (regulator of RNase III)